MIRNDPQVSLSYIHQKLHNWNVKQLVTDAQMIVISAESADNLWVRQANSYKITFPQIPVMGGQDKLL